MKKIKNLVLLILFVILLGAFSGCSNNEENRITDIIGEASAVYINGEQIDTVEAALGAFEGKQGNYIEFTFSEPQTFNTVFIAEKTAVVRQYNIYAKVDGEYMLVHTGKHILQDNITFDEVTATAFKLEIVNTQIGNDNFIIQGISAYNISKGDQNGN